MAKDPKLPSGYHKVWRSYLAQKNRKNSDAHTKKIMRQRILELQKENRVSNYRIYKELGFNPGNINDWLKNGVGEKVSLATARKIFQYIQDAIQGNRE